MDRWRATTRRILGGDHSYSRIWKSDDVLTVFVSSKAMMVQSCSWDVLAVFYSCALYASECGSLHITRTTTILTSLTHSKSMKIRSQSWLVLQEILPTAVSHYFTLGFQAAVIRQPTGVAHVALTVIIFFACQISRVKDTDCSLPPAAASTPQLAKPDRRF